MKTQGLTLYGYPFRSRAERVIWALNEAGLDYEFVQLDPLKGENRHPSFLALNPGGKIPVLVDGDFVLTESLVIMEYISSRAPATRLIPEDDALIWRYRETMGFLASEIEPYLWICDQSTRLSGIYSWPENTDRSSLELASRNLSRLGDQIGSRHYLVGEQFSLADIYACHLLIWSSALAPEHAEKSRSYLDRHLARAGCPQAFRLA